MHDFVEFRCKLRIIVRWYPDRDTKVPYQIFETLGCDGSGRGLSSRHHLCCFECRAVSPQGPGFRILFLPTGQVCHWTQTAMVRKVRTGESVVVCCWSGGF